MANRHLGSIDRYKDHLRRLGWRSLGNGSRAVVYGNPKYPDLAIKVAWKDGPDGTDGWLTYVHWAKDTSSEHAPKVYEVRDYGTFYVAVMERLRHGDWR